MRDGNSASHGQAHGMHEMRKPHAVLDLPSRRLKGLKIEHLLDLSHRHQPIRMLEIGTGSGGIAHYFGTHLELRCEVVAVDVVDNRLVSDGYTYQKVQGVELPFPDASFDVVITNHVIEHVGDVVMQEQHLAEIRRVMGFDGIGYLAVPNRWMLTEPHYNLRFLSWLPRRWRSPYLRRMGKGEFYDCEPLEMRQLESMLARSGFAYRNVCVEAWRLTLEIERPDSFQGRLLGLVPPVLLEVLCPIIPTLIYRIARDEA
jgi:SAM-dependent methyltransferase